MYFIMMLKPNVTSVMLLIMSVSGPGSFWPMDARGPYILPPAPVPPPAPTAPNQTFLKCMVATLVVIILLLSVCFGVFMYHWNLLKQRVAVYESYCTESIYDPLIID